MQERTVRIETTGRPQGCKLMRISADVKDGIITFISIRGDFFASPEAGFDAVEQRMCGSALRDAGSVFNSLLKEEGVEAFGVSGEGLDQLIAESVKNHARKSLGDL